MRGIMIFLLICGGIYVAVKYLLKAVEPDDFVKGDEYVLEVGYDYGGWGSDSADFKWVFKTKPGSKHYATWTFSSGCVIDVPAMDPKAFELTDRMYFPKEGCIKKEGGVVHGVARKIGTLDQSLVYSVKENVLHGHMKIEYQQHFIYMKAKYVDGVLNGKYVVKGPNGEMWSKGTFKDNKLDGKFWRWRLLEGGGFEPDVYRE